MSAVRSAAVAVSSALVLGLGSGRAQAAGGYYVGPNNGTWNTGANWSATSGGVGGNGVPGDGDFAIIDPSNTRNIAYNGSYTTGLSLLTIGSTGAGNPALNISSGTLLLNSPSFYGPLIIGSVGNGSLNLSGSGTVSTTGNEEIGFDTIGTFTQSGGTHTMSNSYTLFLGRLASGNGSYSLSGGTLNAGSMSVGYAGIGTFTQTGGTNTIYANLFLGDTGSSTSNGTYTISNGSLFAACIAVGGGVNDAAGTGTLTINSGGNVTVTTTPGPNTAVGALRLHTAGTVNVNAGGSLSAASLTSDGVLNIANTTSVTIGAGGTGLGALGAGRSGRIVQNGGTFSSGGLRLGAGAGTSGTYSFTGGTVTLTGSSDTIVGDLGNGTFSHGGGTHTTGRLYVGFAASGYGSYTLSGSGSQLSATQEYIGLNGIGVFNQSAGTHTTTGTVNVGNDNGSRGSYVLSGGTYSVGGDLNIGGLGTGTTGQFSLSGTGGLSLTATESIGSTTGNATFTQTGGSNTTGQFQIGFSAGTSGLYNLSGGTLTATVLENLGYFGSSIFNQTGGMHTAGRIYITASTGNSSTYYMSGGSLAVNDPSIPSINVAGRFVHSGGSVNAGGALNVDPSTAGVSSYSLSGAGSTLTATAEYIGQSGQATFTQSGGANNTGFVNIGSDNQGDGTYNLSGGNLTITGAQPYLFVGDANNGTFNQTGGAVSAALLMVGRSASASGKYLLTGGTLSVTAESIGGFNVGTMTQTGGSHTVSAGLSIGNGSHVGNYQMQGGTLSMATLNSRVTFAQSGGSVTASGAMNIFDGGTHTISGGSTTAANLYVGGDSSGANGTGTLAMTGGSLTATGASKVWNTGTVNLNGGTLTFGSGGVTISGVLAGSGGSLVLGGTGGSPAVTINGSASNTFNGFTALNTGSLTLNNSSGNALGAGVITVGNGINSPTLTLSANHQIDDNAVVVVDSGATFNVNNQTETIGELIVIGGTVSGSTNLTTNSSPVMMADGQTNSTSATLVSGLGYATANGLSGATISGALALPAGNHVFAISENANAINDLNVTSVVSGAGGLIKAGPGAMALAGSGANTYSGLTSVTQGTLKLGKSSGTDAVPGSLLITSGGTVSLTNNQQIADSATVTIHSGGLFDLAGRIENISMLSGDGSVALGGGLLTVTGNSVFNGSISGSGTLTKSGAGTALTLGGANTFTAALNISAGTVRVAHPSALGASGASTTLSQGATLDLNGQAISGTGALLLGSAGGSATVLNNAAGVASWGGGSVTLNAAATVTGTGEIGLLTVIGGTAPLTKTGTGTLKLAAANTFSGGLTASAGIVQIGTPTSLGTGTLTLNGAALEGALSSSTAVSNAIVLGSGGATISASTSVGLSLSGAISGSGGLTIDTSNAVLLTGTSANTFSGVTTIKRGSLGLYRSGVVNLGGNIVIGDGVNVAEVLLGQSFISSSDSAVVLNHNGTLNLNSFVTPIGSLAGGDGVVALNGGSLSMGFDNTSTSYGGTFTGSGIYNKAGSGTMTLTGNNTDFTGTALLTGGTLVVASEANLGGTALQFNGGTLQANGTFTLSRTIIDSADNSVIAVSAGNTVSFVMPSPGSSNISGSNSLIKSGAGTLALLSPSSSFTGLLKISAGTVTTAIGTALPGGGGGITLDGGTFQSTGTFSLARAVSVTSNGGSIDVTSGNTLSMGPVSGGGPFVKTGSGTLSVAGVSTFTGGSTIAAGTLSVAAGGGLPSSRAIAVNTGATLDITNWNSAVIGALSGSGAVVIGASTSMSVGADNSTATFSGSISGPGGMIKSGSGTFTLSGANTYTGATTISSGTLAAGIANSIPSASYVAMPSAGAVLDLAGFSQSIVSLSGAVGTSVVNSGATPATLTLNVPSAGEPNANFAGSISGNVSLLVNNNFSTENFSGANTYTGSTTLTGTGGLTISNSDALPVGTDLTIGTNAGFNTNGNNQTIGSLSGSGQVLLSSGSVTVAGPSSTSFTGQINDGGSIGRLNKSGSGTLTLTGANTFSGPVTVSGGVLSISANNNLGTGTNAVVLNAGGTLRTTASITPSRAITFSGGALEVADGTTLTLSGTISGTGGLIKAGGGLLNLSGSSSYGSTINVQGGTVLVGASGALSNGKALVLSPGATFDLGTTSTTGSPKQLGSLSGTGGNLILTTAGELFVGTDNSSTTFGGVISGPFAEFRKLGTGTLTLTGHSTYTGATKIYEGNIKLGVDNALPTNSFLAGVLGGPALDMNGFNQTSPNPSIIINSSANLSTFTINGSTQGVAGFNGAISGNVAIVFSNTPPASAAVAPSGSGWAFNGADSYSGGLTVNGGRMRLTNAKTFSGGVTVNTGGILQADSDAAMGATVSNAITLNGGTLAFNGTYSSARDIAVTATGATLDVGSTAGNALTYTGNLSGSSSVTKSGLGTFNVQSAQSFSGVASVAGGVFKLGGASGGMPSVSAVAAKLSGTMMLDDSTAVNSGGRLNDSADVFLAGGTFSFAGGSGTNSAETARKLVVAGGPSYLPTGGASTVALSSATGGTTTLTFTGGLDLSSRNGATVNFTAISPLGITNLGTSNRVLLTGQADGFIGGWATINGNDFAKYVSGSSTGVTAFAGGDYTTSFTPGAHVRLTAAPPSPIGAASIATLTLDTAAGSFSLTQTAATTLTLSEGGLLKVGANPGTITGGDLTSGRSDGEIDAYINAGTLRIGSRIVNNGATPVSLVKSGAGLMVLGNGSGDTTANTFTGTTYVHQGELDLDKASGTYAIQGPIVITGGSLVQLRPNQINPNAGITISSGTLNFSSNAASLSSLTNLGGDISTGASTVTVETVTLVNGNTTVDPNGTMLITGSGGGGGGGGAAGDGSATGTAGGTPLIISGGTNIVKAAAVLDTPGILFSGNLSPTLQMDAGAGAGYGTLRLGGDVQFTGTVGTAGLITGTIGSGQNAGTIDLKTGTRTFSVSSASATLLVSARLTNGGVIKSGTGTMQLSAANDYSGGTTVQSGTLLVTDTQGLGVDGGTVTFTGGTLALRSSAANVSFLQSVSAAPANSISVDVGATNSATAGAFAMQSATLGAALNVTGGSGGSLSFTGVTLTNANPTGSNNDTAIHNEVDLVINGAINQSGANGDILKDGAGQLTLGGAGANTFTGTMKVGGGTLLMSKSSGVAVPHDLVVLGGGTARLGASNQIATASHVTINAGAGAAALDFGAFNNTIGGGLSFVAGGTLSSGAGVVALASNVDFTGAAGTARVSGNLDLGAAGRTFTIARGSAATDMQIDAIISGGPASGAAMIKDGPGIMALSGTNTFGGGGRTINIVGGTLAVSSDSNLGNAANSLVLGNGSSGAQLRALATFASARPIALTAGGGAVDVAALSTLTLNGIMSGSTGLTKNGSGLLVLGGNNTFSGGIRITGGSISVSSDSNLGDPSNVITLAGGTLLTTGGLVLNRAITFDPTGGTVDAAAVTDVVTLAATTTVGGSGGLTKTGPGTLTINATQNWTAGALLNDTAGTVNVNTSTGAGVLSVRVAGGATTNLNNVAQSLGGLTLESGGVLAANGGAVTLGGAWLVSGTGGQINAAQPTTVIGNAPTSWAGTFTKSGASSLDINRSGGAVAVAVGAGVTINQGTLNAGGSVDPFTDSTVTTRHAAITNNAAFGVMAGTKGVASIGGSGATTVASGATLNVGSSPGAIVQATLTVNGALATNDGSGSVYGPVTLSGTGPVALAIGAAGAAQVGDLTFTGLEAGATIAASGSLVARTVQGGSINTSGNVTLRASTPALTNTLTSLSIQSGGHFDLKNNEVFVQSGSTSSSVRGLLAAGSIQTTTAGGAVGYSDAGGGQVRLKYTLLGDTNLDGKVDVTDLGNLASSYGNTGTLWGNGDSSYDGIVNVTDLGNLASNYGATLGGGGGADMSSIDPTASMFASATAQLSASATGDVVPEPAMLPLAVMGAATMLRRRRRKT